MVNSSSSFQLTSNKSFERDLGAAERQRLEELEEEEEEEEELENEVFPDFLSLPSSAGKKPKKRTGTVTFATSPALFVSPQRKRQKEDLLNITDGGTPKV